MNKKEPVIVSHLPQHQVKSTLCPPQAAIKFKSHSSLYLKPIS